MPPRSRADSVRFRRIRGRRGRDGVGGDGGEGKFDSQGDDDDDSRVFSVRIVSIDYYMAALIPDVDISYSAFQGTIALIQLQEVMKQ
ncbi:hypothetical protein Droror1_Dr00002193 [Drosera rotundifolia]